MSRSREFLRSLAGPHVLFGFAVGFLQAASLLRGQSAPYWLAFGLVAAGAAVLARRLTGNTLVSACAAGIVALHPEGFRELFAPLMGKGGFPGWSPSVLRLFLGDLASAACGLLAAGVRLVPTRELEGAPLLGKREILALVLLVAGALVGDAVLAMPLLILLADLAFSPATPRAVLRRTGLLFPLHAAAVAPAYFLAPATLAAPSASFEWSRFQTNVVGVFAPFASVNALDGFVFDAGWVLVLLVVASIGVILMRPRVRQTLVVGAAFAIVWTAGAFVPGLLFSSTRLVGHSMLCSFGLALLIAAVLWRIAIAFTQTDGPPATDEPPLPSVPALRDLVRRLRAEARPAGAPAPAAASAPRGESAAGMRSAVETAVSGAVAATLEQIRIAFRGPHPTETPGTPEQVLWNRLMTQGSGGAAPDDKPGAALARWRDFHGKAVKARLPAGAVVLCAGATPWPLVAAIAESARWVTLVERGPRPAQIAAADLAAVANATVVRHDGRSLAAVRDGSVDAVLALVEPTLGLANDVLLLLRECRRVLRKGGIAGVAFADLASPSAPEALAKTSQPACFTNKEALDALARLAGFGAVEIAPAALGTTSIAWMRA